MLDCKSWADRQAVCSHLVIGFPVQILGNNECFEPYTSNIYVRRVLSGEFTVVNQHLLSDLTAMGLWSADTKNELVAANGSVQVPELSYHPLWTPLYSQVPSSFKRKRCHQCSLAFAGA